MSQAMQVRQDVLDPFRRALVGAQRHFAQALPQTVARFLTPERLTKITLTAIGRTPVLLSCTPDSILRAVMDSASLGLEPAGPLGHAYLVPFKNKKTNRMEAQLIVGYRGFVALARRSGEIESVTANVVYSRDRFKVNLATSTVEHEPFMPTFTGDENRDAQQPSDRGFPIAVYCVANFNGGGRHVDFMTIGDVERIRNRSKSSDQGPWVTDFEEMARKTVVRRAAKYWPLSTEMADAMRVDDEAESAGIVAAPVFVDAALDATDAAKELPAEAQSAPEDAPPQSDEDAPPMSAVDLPNFDDPASESATKKATRQIRAQQPPAYRARQ